MLRLTNLSVPLEYDDSILRALLLKKLKLSSDQLLSFHVSRRSVDARNKQDVHFVLSVDLTLKNEQSALRHNKSLSQVQCHKPNNSEFLILNSESGRRQTAKPLVVGAGPAGLFAALTLARAGLAPTLIERGKSVDARTCDVAAMQQDGILNPDSNVQFGEGGAGAFSDGKLTCGVKSPHIRNILDTFVAHGAPESILIDQKPHIGTDRLKGVVVSHNGERREFMTDTILLCIGHSARDTVQKLFTQGLRMQQKPFAMGVRIEHPRAFIDKSQYGTFAGHPALGAASYKLICHTPDGRGVYTFCMCPGGEVIAAASQPGGVVTNGMSYHARDGQNSNAALLVGVRPEDFGDDHPLAGFVLQRSIEKAAFRAGPADLRAVLPLWMIEDLKKGIRAMNAQLSGFSCPDAVLTGPETRSSSPVRINRNPLGEAEDIHGLWPVGEGAGYAGGIVSAAADGISAALKVIEKLQLI